MAYEFNGSNQRISSNPPVAAVPYTQAAHVNLTTTGLRIAVSIHNTSASNWGVIFCNSNNKATIVEWSTTVNGVAGETGTVVTGVWEHYCGLFSATNSRTIYRNASNNATNTTTVIPSGLNELNIGAFYNNGYAFFWHGSIGEVGIWNIALTVDEVTSLNKGFKCSRIRPQNLVFYAPLVRNLQDLRNGRSMTNHNSATVSPHRRVY